MTTPFDLAKERGLLGTWLVAGTPLDRAYPCRCVLGQRCSPKWCKCAGRIDLDRVPAHCCSRSANTPAVAAAAQNTEWRR